MSRRLLSCYVVADIINRGGEMMADWMLSLGGGDDLSSAPKERRNLSAASLASAPK